MMEIIDSWNTVCVPWLLSSGIKIILIFVVGYIINKISKRFIEKTVRLLVVPDKYLSKESEIKREDTLIRIFNGAMSILIVIITSLMALQEIGFEIGPILAGAGIVGLAVGFGGQYLIKDIISGFFIILENQYRVGDVVRLNEISGLVEDISLRMTTLRDLDGTVHHIPHGEITRVSNMTKFFSRINLNVRISYNSNMEHVINVVNQVGNTLAEDPAWKEHIIKAPQFLRIDEFAEFAIIIKILGETQPIKQWEVSGELRKRLKVAFDKEGIEIPLPQRVIHSIQDTP